MARSWPCVLDFRARRGGPRCVVHGPKVEGAKAFEAVVLDRAECVVGGGGLVP